MSSSPNPPIPSRWEIFLFILPAAAFFFQIILEFLPDGMVSPDLKTFSLCFLVGTFALSFLCGLVTVLRVLWYAAALAKNSKRMKCLADDSGSAFSDSENGSENLLEIDSEIDSEDDPMETLYLKKDPPLYASQPFDGNWHRDETAEEFTIFRNGKFSASDTLFLFFFTVFWNSIAWLAVVQIARQKEPLSETWQEFLFMVPFVLVGLGTFAGAVLSIFAGKVRKSWTITSREIRYTDTLGGFTRKKEKRDVSRTDRLEIEPDSLWFLSEDEEVLGSIEGLTHEEARWLASRFQQMRGLTYFSDTREFTDGN